ncbi:hypothetical protein BH10CYA1_BH10CYA1_42010 [soil metagenome]
MSTSYCVRLPLLMRRQPPKKGHGNVHRYQKSDKMKKSRDHHQLFPFFEPTTKFSINTFLKKSGADSKQVETCILPKLQPKVHYQSQLLPGLPRDANRTRTYRACAICIKQADAAGATAPACQLEQRLPFRVCDRVTHQDAWQVADSPRGFGVGVNDQCLSDSRSYRDGSE